MCVCVCVCMCPAMNTHRSSIAYIGWTLNSISKDLGTNEFVLSYKTEEGGEKELRAKVVVMATPAYVTAEILRAQAPEVFDLLSTYYYPPVCAVTLAYPMSAVKPDRIDEEGTPRERYTRRRGERHRKHRKRK